MFPHLFRMKTNDKEGVRISQFYDGRKTDGVLLGLFTYGRELMVRRKTVAGGKSPECANNVVEEVEEVLLLLPLLLLLLLHTGVTSTCGAERANRIIHPSLFNRNPLHPSPRHHHHGHLFNRH